MLHNPTPSGGPGFNGIFRALPGLYLILTPDLVIVDATDAYLATTLSSRKAIRNRYFFEVFPNNPATPDLDSAQNFEQSLRYVLQHRQEHTMEALRYDIPRPQEQGGGFEERYWSPINRPILGEDGELLYILHEARDITDQVLQRQESQYLRERLYLLTNALDAVSWEYDIVNNRMSWGKGLQEVFGYTPDEMGPGGESWDSRVHPDDFEKVQQSIQQATSGGSKIWVGEYRFRRGDGTYAHVLDQGYIIYDHTNTPVRTIGSIIDLTKTKQSEQNLRESNARFWHLLEVLPHMAWMADASGRITYFNSNWYAYTGMAPNQVSGWLNAIHPEDSANVLTYWNEAARSGQVYEQEYRIRHHLSGEYQWFLDRGVPMHDEEGRVKSWIGTMTNVDEQHNALSQIQLKDRQLENILKLSPAHLCLLMGPEHICRYVTPGVYRMYGSRRYLGRPACDIWPELNETGFLELLDKVYHEQEPVRIEEFRIPQQPEEAYFTIEYQPILTDDGQTEGLLLSAVEVTELVRCRGRKTSDKKQP